MIACDGLARPHAQRHSGGLCQRHMLRGRLVSIDEGRQIFDGLVKYLLPSKLCRSRVDERVRSCVKVRRAGHCAGFRPVRLSRLDQDIHESRGVVFAANAVKADFGPLH